MKLWLIAENWPPRVGGIERYLHGIASHIPQGGIRVFAPKESHQGGVDEPYVTRKRFFWKPLWPSWLPLFVSLKKQALTSRPDVILCGKALMEGRIALFLKRIMGIPYVVCTYGMEIATWSSQPKNRKRLVTVLTHADKVLCINKQTQQELETLGVPVDRLAILYPGIHPETLAKAENTQEVLAKYKISGPYILTVARLVKRKGIDDLIQAYANLTSEKIPLVIVGDGPEKESLAAQAKTIGDTIIFTGAVSDTELHTLYANATLFALTPKELPGDYEGFGIVYMEAAYYGLPTLGTTTGGVSEAVEDGVTGILAQPGNIESISRGLHTLLTQPTLAKQYGEAGKERALASFTWKQITSGLLTILSTIS